MENIPIDINNIIYLFFRFCDQWSERFTSDDIEIDEDGLTFVVKGVDEHTVFGETVVEDGVFLWRIKILEITTHDYDDGPFVGIIEDDSENLNKVQDSDVWENDGYQLCGYTGNLCSNKLMSNTKTQNYCCKWNKEGDILEISLDLSKQTISFKVNDKDYGVGFKNIKKTKYRLALTSEMGQQGSKFTLL